MHQLRVFLTWTTQLVEILGRALLVAELTVIHGSLLLMLLPDEIV